MTKPKRIYFCEAPAPRELVPPGLGSMRCSREVNRSGHQGDHKAHKVVTNVGRVNIHWKQAKHRKLPSQPPVIDLRLRPQMGMLRGGLVVNLDG